MPIINPVVVEFVDVVTNCSTIPSGSLPEIILNVVPVPCTEKGILTAVLSVNVPKNPAFVIHTGDVIFYNLNKLTFARHTIVLVAVNPETLYACTLTRLSNIEVSTSSQLALPVEPSCARLTMPVPRI